MKLHELREPEGTKQTRKRRCRGIAAGQGKTGGFGTKGQGSRSGRGGRLYFEGGQIPIVNSLPTKRGFRNPRRIAYAVVNVAALNCFDAGTVVDVATLIASGLVRDDKLPVKVLGNGDIDRAITVRVEACSESAKVKIEAVGGTFESA